MSDDAAQRRSEVRDKPGRSDKRAQSSEQEVCEVLASHGFEKEERKKERRSKAEGVRAKESEKDEKDEMDLDGGDKKDEAEEFRRTRRSVIG